MAEAHHCIVKGCGGIACFGFGSSRNGTLRFACRDHRDRIGWQAAPPSPRALPAGEGPGLSPARPSHPEPEQGRLL